MSPEDETPEPMDQPEDPETVTASERTRDLIHELAVGLTRLGEKANALKAEALASPTGQRLNEAAITARSKAQQAAGAAKQRAADMRTRSGPAGQKASETLAAARAVALGLLHKAETTTEHTVERLAAMSDELGERARKAADAGKDFYEEHREEIVALLLTAAKVAAVIGIRRLTAPREDEEGLETKVGRQKAAKRVLDAAAVLTAVVTQLGHLLSRQPSSLPMLREMYARGEPSEQAIVGMLLGPALSADPDHAVDVVHEFLQGATTEGAADTIARRTLAPLLADNPELVARVTPWFKAAAPLVRRGALIALSRVVADRRSRVGDIVAAAVVVLEDHDEEVRQALVKLFRSSHQVDPEATARVLADQLESPDEATRERAERLLEALPEDLVERVEDARTDREA